MITKNEVRKGIESSVICFMIDPNMGKGTVASIGDNWFYFGGEEATFLNPEEYLKTIPSELTVDAIFEALDELRTEDPDEYEYYRLVLDERLPDDVFVANRSNLSDLAEWVEVFYKGQTYSLIVVYTKDYDDCTFYYSEKAAKALNTDPDFEYKVMCRL